MEPIQMLTEPNEGLYYDAEGRPHIRIVFPDEFQALRDAGIPVVEYNTLWRPYRQQYHRDQDAKRQLDLFQDRRPS